MSADQNAPMDSTKSRPTDTTERASPGRENVAGGAVRISLPQRSSGPKSRARASPPADPTVKHDTEHSSRASPEKTNHGQSDLADDRNRTADTRRPDKERDGENKRETEKEIRETRDSRPRDSNRTNFQRTIGNHLGFPHRHDQRRGDPQEEDRNDDRLRQNNRSNPQRTNSSSNHPDQRPGDPQEEARNDDRLRQNDRSNPQRTSRSHPDSHHVDQRRGDPQEEDRDDGRMQPIDAPPDPQRTGGSRPDSHRLDHGGGAPQEDIGEDGGRDEEGERREIEDRRPSSSQHHSHGRHGQYRGRNPHYRHRHSDSQHHPEGHRPSDSQRRYPHGRYRQETEQQIRALLDEKSEQAAVIDELKAQLARAEGERDQLDELLKERTAELSSAQAFLGKADSISVTEVSKMIELLNAEVQQVSAHIADSLTQRKGSKDDQADQAELKRALNEVKPYIGPRLQSVLLVDITDKQIRFDQTLSQIVLQAGLINACARVIKEWNPPAWESRSNVENIYNSIRSSSGQAIAGRWRALARTYIEAGGENNIQVKSTEFLKLVLRNLLIAIGWAARGPHVPTPLQFEERIDIIAKKAIEVQQVIGKGITSADLCAHGIPSEEWFHPDSAIDAYEEGKEGPVLCTLELGLQSEKIVAPGNAGAEQRENATILKPKVVLVSALEGLRKSANV